MEETKSCKTCLKIKSWDNFYRNKKGHCILFSECKSCFNLRSKNYRKNNLEKVKATEAKSAAKNRPERLLRMREYYSKLRNELFNAYGNKCACCGETRKEFFAIDHIQGGGNLEKRKYGTRPLFRKIKADGYPKDKYQILCHNCNMSLGFYGYCPHNPSVKRTIIYGGKTKPEWTNANPI